MALLTSAFKAPRIFRNPIKAFGFGFQKGSGSTVTQATSSSTGVTVKTPAGQITTVALTTAAAGIEQFTVTNAKVGAADTIILATTYAGAGTPILQAVKVVEGAFDIVIKNVHASAAFNAAMVINFAVIKGQTA